MSTCRCAVAGPSAGSVLAPDLAAFATAVTVVALAATFVAPARATGDAEPFEGGELPPTVFADGRGLPAGEGRALEGAALYAERCAGCHGAEGEGGRAVELVGDRASLAGDYPDRGIGVRWPYAPPLFDYVRRAMPPDAPYSLDASETYAVVARLLELNGLIGAATRVDAAFLSALRLPNADGFDEALD